MLYFPMGEVLSLLQTRVPRFGVGARVCFLAYGASVILLYFLSLALKIPIHHIFWRMQQKRNHTKQTAKPIIKVVFIFASRN